MFVHTGRDDDEAAGPSGSAASGWVQPAEVHALTKQLAGVLSRLDPDEVPASRAPELWRELRQLARLAEGGAMLLARKVDESGAWKRDGCRSGDEWRARESGSSVGDAKRQGRASNQLKELGDTADALRRGELSADQAEAISDAASANPGAEKKLLGGAKDKSLKDLRDDCAKARAAGDRDPEGTQRRIRAERRLSIYGRPDGSAGLSANGPVDEAAVVDAALRPLIDQFYRERRNTPDMASRDAYAWDALVQMARDRVGEPTAAGNTSGPTGEPGATATKKSKNARRSPRYLAIIRLDHSALVRGWAEGDEVCEIPGLGPIPVTRARELLGDSSLRLVLTKGVDVQNVTYLGRGVNAAQQVALWWSQPLCTNIACHRTHLQNDHRDPHARVKCTRLENMNPVCGHDHDLKTHHGWALVPGTGRRAFVPPDDPRHPKNSGGPPGGNDAPGGDPLGHQPDRPGEQPEPPPDQLFPDTS